MTTNYIYIEDYGGIYIPDYKKAFYNVTNNNFLEIYIEHGIKIKNELYKYFIVPKVDKNNFEKIINNFEIISDNNQVIAIMNKKTILLNI